MLALLNCTTARVIASKACLAGSSVIIGVVAVDILGLIESGINTTQLAGTVSSKRKVANEEGSPNYYIQVRERAFNIKDDIYYWVSEGEEVVVTFWPHTNIVTAVRKLGAATIPADVQA